jgi:hypothetical protein
MRLENFYGGHLEGHRPLASALRVLNGVTDVVDGGSTFGGERRQRRLIGTGRSRTPSTPI